MLYIKNISNGKKYILKYIKSISTTHDNGVSTIPVTEGEAEDTQITKFNGMTRHHTITFEVIDSDIDLSDGTNSTPIKTIDEQIRYLLDGIITSSIEDEYELMLPYWTTPKTGLIASLDITDIAEDPRKVGITMRFIIGKNVV